FFTFVADSAGGCVPIREHSRRASFKRYDVPMLIPRISAAILAATVLAFAASRPPDILFERHMLDPGAAETAAVADINRDGKADIVSGDQWYESPTWKPHHFRDLHFQNNYVDAFSDLPMDVD